jgi:3-oxoacyl-(acyl-carrier-protein) synthase
LQYAIEAALQDAGLKPSDIDAIVPHAPGVPDVDIPEAGALEAVFGAALASIPLITITPNVGDMLSGQSGLMAVVGAKALFEQMLPARLHAGTPRRGLLAAAAPAAPAKLKHVLVCTGSMGGQNAAMILSRC